MTQPNHTKTVKYQKGEINWMLAALIAAIVIGIAAFMYAHDSASRIANQQITIDKLQSTVTAQQEMLDKAATDILDLQTTLQTQDAKLESVVKDVQAMKEAERKRIEKAKLAAKPKPKVIAKPKAPVKKKK